MNENEFADDELERMYISYIKRKYEGRTVNFGTHIITFEEFKKQMFETKFVSLPLKNKEE